MSEAKMDATSTLLELRKRHRKELELGNAAAAVQDYVFAEKCYRQYLKKVPDDPKVLFNLGALRQLSIKTEKDMVKLHQLAIEAVAFYADAIGSRHLDPETKADCFNNHGLIMGRLGFPDKAKIAFHFALQLWPEHRAARLNFADLLVFDGEYDAADREFFEIINADPQSAGAQFSRAMILLLTGDIRRGFREYRARFRVPSCVSKIMTTDKPMWNGEPLDGKILCITQEQGWGDSIMFIRYAHEIKKRWPSARIQFSVADSLHRLLRGVKGLDECLPDHLEPEFKEQMGRASRSFDFHVPLMHLPDIMGTTLETIPNDCPYIFPQDDWIDLNINLSGGVEASTQDSNPNAIGNTISHGRMKTCVGPSGIGVEIIGPKSSGSSAPPAQKIGLCWAGSPVHGKDKWRSMKPEHFQRFIDSASRTGDNCQSGSDFFSLQCGPRAHETEQLKNCINLPKQIHDWTQTAHAILQMDLIISVDTAIAHLAGALGVPCWILLPTSPDFRWMLGRADSPWYPKARLFRQETRDDWEPVIIAICEALVAASL